MPACFQLTRKGDTSPAMLEDIDRAVCQRFPEDFTYSATNYGPWYEYIGFMLALGKSFDEILDKLQMGRMHRVTAFLAENYTNDAWYER